MPKTAKIFFAGVITILVGAVVIGLLLPAQWTAEARVVVNAEPAKIHEFVGDLSKWDQWAITDMDKDPTAEITIDGSTLSWKGDKVGRGWFTILESDPATGIKYEAAIQSPEVNSRGWIKYEKEGEGTLVIWHDEGDLPPLIGGYTGGMMGEELSVHYKRSLEKLKEAAER